MIVDILPASSPVERPILTDAEREVVKEVLDDPSRLDVAIPSVIEPDRLWAGLSGSCKIQQGAASASNKVKPIIGRFLIVLQNYPEVVQEKGFKTYEDFMCKGMSELFGISRSEAYACRAWAERLPSLTVHEIQKIGTAKMHVLSKETRDGAKGRDVIVEKAMDPSVSKKELIAFCDELAHRNRGESELTDVRITVTKEVAKTWREMANSPEVQAYVSAASGTGASEGLIFEAMMAECLTEWQGQGRSLLEGPR